LALANLVANPEQMISTEEVWAVIFQGALIEDSEEDLREHSCLMLAQGHQGRPIHVVCVPKPSPVA
jgi:hypothetical protein